MLVAGVDSSTQSTKVLLCEAADGTVVARGSAPHPPGTEMRPGRLVGGAAAGGRGTARPGQPRSAVAAQQHGMVVLDDAGEVIRPALLWNDLRSAGGGRAS